MKIVLISLDSTISSLGLRMISSSLKKARHDTKMIFIPKKQTEKEVDDALPHVFMPRNVIDKQSLDSLIELSKGSDLVGISLTTNYFDNAVQITMALKKNFQTPIIWGGIHATLRPEECLEYANFVCRGEGEEAIVELADCIENNKDYKNIKNICFKNEAGKKVINPVRPLVCDLDSLPLQDFEIEKQFIIVEGKILSIKEAYKQDFFAVFSEDGAYRTYATKGCFWGCTYCCNDFLNKLYSGQNVFRKRSIDGLIKELVWAKNNIWFINHICFSDDSFLTMDEKDIEAFSKRYKQEVGLPIRIDGAHPLAVSHKKIEYLVNAGLFFIRMGIQSGSKKTKKTYNRNYSNNDVLKACKILNQFGVKNKQYDIIINNPWETKEDEAETLMLISKIPVPYKLCLFSLTFFPETTLYYSAKMEGIIKNEREEIYEKNYWTYSLSHFSKIFFLMCLYAEKGKRIYPFLMFLLTNNVSERLKISQILYKILQIRIRRARFPKNN